MLLLLSWGPKHYLSSPGHLAPVTTGSQSELVLNRNAAMLCYRLYGLFFDETILAELGRVRTCIFSLAKINCHRNYVKVFAFTHNKEYCYRSFVKESLLMSLRLFLQSLQKQRVFVASHIFDKC